MVNRSDPSSARDPRLSRTWAEIDLPRLMRNIAELHTLCHSESALMAVVKADAYGHGAVGIAATCAEAGVRHFGVACVDEGRALRRSGIRHDIYVLSPFLPEEADDIVYADLVPMISSVGQIDALARAAAGARLPARCFLTVDTGMGREGCLPNEALSVYRRCEEENVRITGISTHFSRADEPGVGDAVTAEQAHRFFAFLHDVAALKPLGEWDDRRGGRGPWLTLANSPATLRLDHGVIPVGARGFLKRCGLLIYGIEPYPGAFSGLPGLAPVLSWRARVTLLRDLPAGATIGYGQTHTLDRPSRIATLAVGYADGLSRDLSNGGVILLHGRRYPLVGRVSMDQCQVDVSSAHGDIAVGDVATLIGTDGDESLTVSRMAEAIHTTPHQPTCALSGRVPRIIRGP